MDFAPLIARQRAFFKSGATYPLEFRRAQLKALAAALVKYEPALFEALYADLRKNPHEAYTAEIGLVLSEIHHALRCLPAWMKPKRKHPPLLAWPARGYVRPEPYGVALIIGPWNYPLQLLLSPLVGAIAAGNCAVLKPSEYAPHTAAVIGQIIKTTLPEEYVTVVAGEQDIAEALLNQPFDTIFFTGSSKVGRLVMSAAARHLTPVTLELGGKSPCLVCADAPLEITARRIAWGKFMNAGQTCVAPDFVLVDRKIREPLVEMLKRVVREFYGNDPQQSPNYGRIINRKHFDRLIRYLDDGQIAGGGQHDEKDLYVAPAILTNPAWNSPVMQEEIFGPILPVLEFTELDEALTRLREQPTPLALYLFTHHHNVQERVLAVTRSGGVCINDTVTHMIGKNLPFGGMGESGMGGYRGQASFDCFTHRRSVLHRSLAFDPKLRYPPPGIELSMLKRVYRFLAG